MFGIASRTRKIRRVTPMLRLSRGFLAALPAPALLTVPTPGFGPRSFDFAPKRLGLGNTGALNGGITTVPGGFGTLGAGWKFSGSTSQSINLATDLFAGLQKLTLFCVLNPAVVSTAQSGVFSCTKGSSNDFFDGIVGVLNAGDIFFRCSTLTTGYVTTAASTLSAGATATVAFVYDGTLAGATNILKIFVNGNQQATTSGGGAPATSVPSSAVATLLGRYYDQGGNNKPFTGQILFFGAFASALSAAQVSSLYSCLLTGEPFPLFAPQVSDLAFGSAAAVPSAPGWFIGGGMGSFIGCG